MIVTKKSKRSIFYENGVYRFAQMPVTRWDAYMLATLWPAGRGVLSHQTALELHELCEVNPTTIHIVVPTEYAPRRKGGAAYTAHRHDLADHEVTWREGATHRH